MERLINQELSSDSLENGKSIIEGFKVKLNTILNPGELNESQIKDYVNIASLGFGIKMDYSDVMSVVKNDLFIELIIDSELIGFISIKIYEELYYIDGIVITKKHQGRGISKYINSKLTENFNKNFFYMTQNLSLINSFKNNGYNVYLGKKAENKIIGNIGKEEFDNFINNRHYLNGVFIGLYGAKLGDKTIRFINEDIYEGFNLKRGDSLLVFCEKI